MMHALADIVFVPLVTVALFLLFDHLTAAR